MCFPRSVTENHTWEERAWRPGCGVLEGLLYYMNRGDAVVHEEVGLQ